MRPLINPSSEATLQLMAKDLPQSLILTGPEGIGLTTISQYLANLVGAVPLLILPEKDDKIDLEKGTITVDIVRRLYAQTKNLSTSKQVIIIDHAERMGIQAQNAFLKLLEEPSSASHFILATHRASTFLPTIRSRAQSVELQPIAKIQTEELLNTLEITDSQKRAQLLFIATGLPAEIHRLVSNEMYFDARTKIIRDARELLQGSQYNRLKIGQIYKDKRPECLLMLRDAANILRRSMASQPQGSIISQINKLINAHDKIEANGNIRLCIARLVL